MQPDSQPVALWVPIRETIGLQLQVAALPNDLTVPLVVAAMVGLLALVVIVLWVRASRRRLAAEHKGAKEGVKESPALTTEGGAAAARLSDREARSAAVIDRQRRNRELQAGLGQIRGGFIARLTSLLSRKKIDADLLEQLEETLLTADIGVKTAERLFGKVKQGLSREELKDTDAVLAALKEESRNLLSVEAPALDWQRSKPFVLLVIGVNGGGKTTTIGKLAAQQIAQGRKVLLAAGDTFRAAAVQQLEVWGQRVGARVVKGKEGADPSSVAFEAVKQAQREGPEGADVVIIDTAGRLQVKVQLMEELKKIRRVIQKAEPTAPHETWLVLDSTNGQNAISQAGLFKEAMEISGIVLTKLDGTAKGGVILGICNELQVPVRYIGIGERVDDLRPFEAADFVDALYDSAALV